MDRIGYQIKHLEKYTFEEINKASNVFNTLSIKPLDRHQVWFGSSNEAHQKAFQATPGG
jgi:hypothetical protein